MIRIRFTDHDAKIRGLGFLAGRFSFKTFEDGLTLVPETALIWLAREGIPFGVEGPASYAEEAAAFRNPLAEAT